MDRSDNPGGSIRGARERAEAALRMNDQRQYGGAAGPNGVQQRPPRPQALQGRTGPIGNTISRPTQVPQWPLAGPLPSSSVSSDSQQSQQGRQQPPQRPPRPSRVPSILDNSRVQDPTPVFQYQPQNVRDSDQTFTSSVPPTPSSVQTNSTIASIPDFPLPVAAPPAMPPPRRSVTLGPPPSARRGASSFYSTLSYVSPIPEESPRTRSYTSLASSAAMPESFGSPSPGMSPAYPEPFYGDIMSEEGRQNQNNGPADEGGLVRSASLGKRGKPQIVMNKGTAAAGPSQRPQPRPVQENNPFADGTFFTEASSSESIAPVPKSTTPPTVAEAIATEPAPPPRRMSSSPSRMSYNRLSAIRRPPRLDMEAVEKAQARGSMTSLPDLIRRATRLAAMIDIGKRPGSRFDDFDYPDEKAGGQGLDRFSMADDRHQSGLSDMLAAFPPPAQATSRASRVGSWFRNSTSWPLPNTRQDVQQPRGGPDGFGNPEPTNTNRKRRFCGLPLWGFILLILVIIGIIAAAILVPLQFFVFRNRGGPLGDALAACRSQITCENGGTNVVVRDVCSCICTNGFTGSTCAVAGSAGCTTTNLVNMDESPNIDNVTLGQAIPRLLAEAQGNFSVPLSGTQILARFNTDSLSCTAQNSLVTFDGRSMRTGAAQAAILAGEYENDAAVRAAAFVSVSVITVLPAQFVAASTAGGFRTLPRVTTLPGGFIRTLPPLNNAILPPTTTTTVTTTLPPVATPPVAGPTFAVSEEVLDFARVAVLFILQENDVDEASQAQSTLQRFFSSSGGGAGMPMESAAGLDLGNGNAIDLVNLRVDVGSGAVGGRQSRRRAVEGGRAERRAPRACLNVDQL